MLKKHALTTLVLLGSTTLYANNIPVEVLGLSQPAANTSTATSNLNWQLMQKNQELESDVRRLRGLLEEQDNEISKLKNELNNRYTDLDQRLELLYQKVDPEYVSINENTQTPTTQSSYSPVAIASTVSQLDETPVALEPTNIAPAPSTTLPSYNVHNLNTNQTQTIDAAKNAYNLVLNVLRDQGAKSAISPMMEFVKNYPDSIYTSSAYFGLGEFHFTAPSNYAEAKKYFQIMVDNYPNSPRTPRSLVRLYDIALNVEQNQALAEQYKNTLLTRYPSSEEAIKLKTP